MRLNSRFLPDVMLSEGCFFFVVGLLQECEQALPKSVVRCRDVNWRQTGVAFPPSSRGGRFCAPSPASWGWLGLLFRGRRDKQVVTLSRSGGALEGPPALGINRKLVNPWIL